MSVQELPVEMIRLSPFNTRGEILDEDLESLVQSIRETGLVEPLKVRTVLDGAYELVSGERRLRAMKILGVEHASCIMREMSDAEVLLDQWAENEERKDLSDYAKAQKLRQMLDALKITQDELAKKLGKTQQWVSLHIQMLRLEPFTTPVVLYKLSEFQARAILSAPDEDIPVICAEVERHYEEEKTLPSAADIADFIKGMRAPGTLEDEFNGIAERLGIGPSTKEVKLSLTQDHEHVYDAGSTHCRICGRELTAPESVAAGIGPICASGQASTETGPGSAAAASSKPGQQAPTPSEEEIFAFLNRFKYEKDVDGIILDNMIGLFGLSASQALDWLEKWRDARAKSPKLTPEEKAFLEEYERTHPKEDDPLKKLVKYYPAEIMDTVLSRVHSDNFETILKYCRRYIEELHIRAPDELRKASLEAIRW